MLRLEKFDYFFRASSTATATETVAPTMGLLPLLNAYETAPKLCIYT